MPSPLRFQVVTAARQPELQQQHSWFRDASHSVDLVLWHDQQYLAGLDFSYRQQGTLKLLRWQPGQPEWHGRVDEGEDRPGHIKGSALLLEEETADRQRLQAWLEQAEGLPDALHQAAIQVIALRPPDPVPVS